jgi:hypothetical protein
MASVLVPNEGNNHHEFVRVPRKKSESTDLSSILKNVTLGYWLRASFKIAVLLILPYGIDFWTINTLDRLYYYSIAFKLMFSRYYEEWSVEFANPITLLLALILCIPAICFNLHLSKMSRKKSIRISGMIVVVIITLLGILFGQGLSSFFFPGFQDLLTGNLVRFTTLVLVMLVFLPILSRETSLFFSDRATAETNNAEEKSDVQYKGEFLGVALGLLIFVMPYILLVDIHTSFRVDYHLFGSVTHFLVEHDIRYSYIAINFSLFDAINLIFYLSVASFQVFYSYSVLRYLRGIESRSPSLICGVLSMLVPLVPFSITSSFYVRGQSSYLVPVPVLFLIGAAALWFMKPVGLRVRKDRTAGEFEERHKDDQEFRVPYLYSLSSRIRKFLSKLRKNPAKEGGAPAGT